MFDFMLQECVFSISLSDSLNIKSNIKPKFYGECLHPLIVLISSEIRTRGSYIGHSYICRSSFAGQYLQFAHLQFTQLQLTTFAA